MSDRLAGILDTADYQGISLRRPFFRLLLDSLPPLTLGALAFLPLADLPLSAVAAAASLLDIAAAAASVAVGWLAARSAALGEFCPAVDAGAAGGVEELLAGFDGGSCVAGNTGNPVGGALEDSPGVTG